MYLAIAAVDTVWPEPASVPDVGSDPAPASAAGGVTVEGAGFLLNNEMDDVTSKPGAPNVFGLVQGEANAIAPHKRPLSSITPTLVVGDGKVRLVLGSQAGEHDCEAAQADRRLLERFPIRLTVS